MGRKFKGRKIQTPIEWYERRENPQHSIPPPLQPEFSLVIEAFDEIAALLQRNPCPLYCSEQKRALFREPWSSTTTPEQGQRMLSDLKRILLKADLFVSDSQVPLEESQAIESLKCEAVYEIAKLEADGETDYSFWHAVFDYIDPVAALIP